MTLKSGEFERGNKSAQRNIEVKVTVYDRDGQPIKVSLLVVKTLKRQSQQKSSAFLVC